MGWIHSEDIVLLPVSREQYEKLRRLGYGEPDGTTVKQYALSLNISQRTVYRWLSTPGKIPARKVGGEWRILPVS